MKRSLMITILTFLMVVTVIGNWEKEYERGLTIPRIDLQFN
jgi:hypothetical protein